MQIEVEIYGPLHACCHPGFAVGESVSWEIARLRHPDGTIVYELDDHETFSGSGVPVAAVAAQVVAIHYIDRHFEPAIGDPAELLPTDQPPRITPTTSVPEGTDFDHDLIHVTLLLDDPGQLPEPCAWDPQLGVPADPGRDEETALAQFSQTSTSVALLELGARLVRRYEGVARVRIDQQGRGSMLPLAPDAADVHWNLDFTQIPSQLVVLVADARWSFPLDVPSIAQLEQIVEAAAAGRVRDRQRARIRSLAMEMSIELADGTTLKQREKVEGFRGRTGFAVVGTMGDRLGRSGRYEPWG